MAASSVPCDHGTENATPVPRKKRGSSSHALIRAGRPNLGSQPLPLSRNEAVGDRLNQPLQPRQLNREALSDRLTPLAIPQRAANHPEHTVERGDHDSQTNPEDGDTRVDDEPFHHEAHGTSASVTTTRKPALRAHTARAVERARKRDTVAETHFQSNLPRWMSQYVVSLYRTISHNVNTVLLQHTPNLLSLSRIHASNTNAAVDLAVTVLNNFELKRDAIQTENNFPTQ